MIYPPAPDIWACEVLFRQSQGASAKEEEAGVGTWSWRASPKPAFTRRCGCRLELPRTSTPLRCVF